MKDAVHMFDNTLSYIRYPFVRMSVPEFTRKELDDEKCSGEVEGREGGRDHLFH